jgi:hypothetical protein
MGGAVVANLALADTTKPETDPARTESSEGDAEASLRLHLRYGIGTPEVFFPALVTDERVELKPARNRKFVQLPIAYRVSDKRQSISRGTLKVKTGEGRICPIKGVRLASSVGVDDVNLLAGAGLNTTVPADLANEITAPSDSDPLWERIMPKKDKDGFVHLECYNTTHPKRERGSGGGGANRTKRKGIEKRSANGLALFLLEMPDDAQSLVCTVRSDPPIETTVKVALLQSLSADDFDAEPAAVADLAVQIAEADGPVADALVGQLARINPGNTGPASADGKANVPDPIAQGFIAALGHPDSDTRRSAFDILLHRNTLSEAILDQVAASENQRVFATIEGGVTEAVAIAKGIQDDPLNQPIPLSPDEARLANIVPSSLPLSKTPANTFKLLSAALRSRAAGQGTQAVELILADATKQSISALANVSVTVQGTMIKRLDSVQPPDLALTVVKTLLLAPHPSLVKPLLAAAAKMQIKINDPDDPLLTAPLRVKDPVVKASLLTALAQLPLDAVFETPEMERVLNEVSDPAEDPKVLAAMVNMLQVHWHPSITLPNASRRGGLLAVTGGGGGFSELLVRLINTEEVDAQVAAAAAGTLAIKGQLAAAADAVGKVPPPRRIEILEHLVAGNVVHSKLTAFFATQAGTREVAVADAALRGLDKMIQATPAEARWRTVTELKVYTYFDEVVNRTDDRDANGPDRAERTYRVITAAASLTPEQAQQLRSRANAASRKTYLSEVDYELGEKPAGEYQAILYADVLIPLPPPGKTPDGRDIRPRRFENVQYDVPFDLGRIKVRAGQNGDVVAAFGEKDVPMRLQASRGAPGTIDMFASLTFDAAPVLIAALSRAPQGKELATLMSAVITPENNPLANTKLEYVAFGRWQSTIDRLPSPPSAVGSSPTAPPVWLKEARIVLERVNGAPTQPTVAP